MQVCSHSLVPAIVLRPWYQHSHEDNGNNQDNYTDRDQHRNYDTGQFAFLTLEHNSLWGWMCVSVCGCVDVCVCGGGGRGV